MNRQRRWACFVVFGGFVLLLGTIVSLREALLTKYRLFELQSDPSTFAKSLSTDDPAVLTLLRDFLESPEGPRTLARYFFDRIAPHAELRPSERLKVILPNDPEKRDSGYYWARAGKGIPLAWDPEFSLAMRFVSYFRNHDTFPISESWACSVGRGSEATLLVYHELTSR